MYLFPSFNESGTAPVDSFQQLKSLCNKNTIYLISLVHRVHRVQRSFVNEE